MGHYVIARALGFQTGDVTIKLLGPLDGHHGTATITLSEAIKSLEDVRLYLERRVIVLYAGALAETLPYSASPTKRVDVDRACEILENPGQGAEQDHAKVRELVHALRNISHLDTDLSNEDVLQGELDELNGKLLNRAVELVEKLAETITGLADNLAGQVKAVKEIAILKAEYLEGLRGVQQIELVIP